MEQDNSRNTMIFVVCAVAIMLAYQMFVLGPQQQKRQAEAQSRAAAAAANPIAAAPAGAAVFVDRAAALAQSPRVRVETPLLMGSISLKGGRIDDLLLKGYRQTIDKASPPVELFRPEGAKQAYFADLGWTGSAVLPTPATVWTLASGTELGPDMPIVLTWNNGQGLQFNRTVSVDDRYMFTVVDTVVNRGAAPVQLAPYASVQRQGLPADVTNNMILHEGAVGHLGGIDKLLKFKDWKKKGLDAGASTGGWLGITDKYWLAAVAPEQNEQVQGAFRVSSVNGVDVYEANFVAPARNLAPGMQTTQTSRVFAGAKKVSILQDYEKALGIPRFDKAVDWGNFWFLTRPIFWLLEKFHSAVGNFGVAILLLTITVRTLFFPLANKSYESMSKMKKLQPKMEEIKKKNEKDPAKQQQEIMEMYKREKVNPLAGCLPLLLQIPVFYALYKVLFVTLEMRHAPFVAWIRDLSAPDSTTVLNLFGLIPWNPATTPLIGGFLDGPLHIGVLPFLYGFTMWLTTAMSPPPSTDPTQKLIFQFFPVIFTFTLARSPAGLLLYWTFSNLFTIGQQYIIMHRLKVENPIDNFLGRFKTAKA
ncbi:MAG: membrane protein insertase YidC [Caulobacterales bacterium 32-69-10]|nr:MAG: membrane protein insertase YidC [Caulobacterales bacterium 32-69-10]